MTAQLVLKTRPGANYEDGDIVSAYSRRRIRHVNAQLICCVRDGDGKKPAGRLRDGTLLETYLAATQTYKWERVSRTEVKRTNLRTASDEN